MEIWFLGGYPDLVSKFVEYVSQGPYAHTGVYINVAIPFSFKLKEEDIEVPIGKWMIHATPCTNEQALGPAKQGVIIVPVNPKIPPASVCTRVKVPASDNRLSVIISALTDHYGTGYGYASIAASYIPGFIANMNSAFICTSFVSYILFELYNYETKYAQSPIALYRVLTAMPGAITIGQPQHSSRLNAAIGILMMLVTFILSCL